MDGHGLHGLGRLVLNRSPVGPVQDERQRAVAEEVAMNLQFRQRVAELADRRVRGVVDEHLLGPRLWRDVVHNRHALVEEVPAAALDIPTHPVARDPLPFEAGDELAGNLVQVLHQKRERLARRLLRREHLDDAVADQQVVAVAVDGGVGDEVVQVRVVREPGGVDDGRFVVHELAEEPEGLALLKARRAKVADLHLETLSLVVQRPDGSIEFRINELQRSIGRQPGAESLARRLSTSREAECCVERRAAPRRGGPGRARDRRDRGDGHSGTPRGAESPRSRSAGRRFRRRTARRSASGGTDRRGNARREDEGRPRTGGPSA